MALPRDVFGAGLFGRRYSAEVMRIAILGNSGSGKSTLARWLASAGDATLLDLDTVAWEPNMIAVPRSHEPAAADVVAFCRAHPKWVIEGCYADLVHVALQFRPRLIFLNPGEEICREHCRARPWEAHKYSSRVAQDERLPFLLEWVSDYYRRAGPLSLVGHRTCFDEYPGPKDEVVELPLLNPPSRQITSWLRES